MFLASWLDRSYLHLCSSAAGPPQHIIWFIFLFIFFACEQTLVHMSSTCSGEEKKENCLFKTSPFCSNQAETHTNTHKQEHGVYLPSCTWLKSSLKTKLEDSASLKGTRCLIPAGSLPLCCGCFDPDAAAAASSVSDTAALLGAAPHLSVGFRAGLRHPSAAEPASNMLKGAMLTICGGAFTPRYCSDILAVHFSGGPGAVWGVRYHITFPKLKQVRLECFGYY